MSQKNNEAVRMIPLGGVGQIGKNMMVLEYGDEMLIIDSGVMFPEDDQLGIDLVIPDFDYVKKNKDKIKGIVLTHGHLDHIGALPFLLKEINVPIYGTKLTLGLLEGNLKEHRLMKSSRLKVVNAGSTVQVGQFKVDYIKVNHSLTDTCALAIHTPLGPIVYASDFKFDQTPVDGEVADFHKLAELGHSEPGVLALFSDSTNVERKGYTMSEKVVGETIDDIFYRATNRIIVATFASNIHRIQQILDAAVKYDRKIAITGRSMTNNVEIARRLGYINVPDDMIVDIRDMGHIADDETVIITTGSQGEPMAALTRMARGDHYHINIKNGDTVVISASAIPGNEKFVGQTINQLFERGANVIYEDVSGVHVSGHASQEELKLMLNLTKPKYFVPTHGEARHLHQHAALAEDVGVPKENTYIAELGDVIEFREDKVEKVDKVQAGDILVDGLGIGDVGNIVLRDRKTLSEDGIIIVVVTIDSNGNIQSGPDIITRGFVYIRESEKLIEDATNRVKDALEECEEKGITEWSVLKKTIKNSLNNYIYKQIKRNPMILPIIMQV
ncbi:ribonuclease J [Halanaerobiaceae bacterium Z-7014]|uniref:Ribonuclease J n=1 Tax=Halonatronomonas betaini TaxID=2778430 RepID=A0A931F7F5_9FIRM|nr:ribonuclease J [Halonatronomonas betaini]MBF8436616.1 ribonuclease J [Halonatronomonas betaini]